MRKFCAGVVVGVTLSICMAAWAEGGYFSVNRYLRSDSDVKSAYVAGIADFVEYQAFFSSRFPGVEWGWLVPCAGEHLSGQTEGNLMLLFNRYIQKRPEILDLAASSQFVLAVADDCDKAPPYWKAGAKARE